MLTKFTFITEDNRKGEVEFSVTKNTHSERCYGIRAVMLIDGIEAETENADNIYFTEKETEHVIDMLCRHQALPSTVCDILQSEYI